MLKAKVTHVIVATLRFSRSFYYETISVTNPPDVHKNIQLCPICAA